MTRSSLARFGLACTLAAGVASLAAPASAQEGVTVKNILGNMGIVPEEKDPIRYRERAPLVLPPKGVTDLREPAGQTDYVAANPQWPSDPDVAARRRREADARAPATQSEIRRMSENNPRLSPQELGGSRTANTSLNRTPGYGRGDDARDVLYLSPDALRAGRKVDDGTEDEQPRRRTLSEPPAEFRKSAQGKRIEAVEARPRIDQQARDANPLNWIREQFGGAKDDDDY